MFMRFAPWWILAVASAALFVCAIWSFTDTGDFMLFLLFGGMGALVGIVANAKRIWATQGRIPSLLSYEFTRRTFGPSDHDTRDTGA